MKTEWCETKDKCLGVLGFHWQRELFKRKAPTRVRCAKCKRRFKPFIRECHDPGCLHWYLPKHKSRP